MKQFNFKSLANVRTQKDEFSENVVATSVTGAFRFPPKAAEKLGIKDFDALSIFTDTDEETGKTTIYMAKGHAGTIARDAEGNIITGTRGTTTFEESDPIDGAIVRTTTEGSKILSVTSSATWKMIGGSKEKELVLSLESIGEHEYPLPSGKMVTGEVFALEVIAEREGAARQKKEKKDDTNEEDAVADALTSEDFQEEEV